MNCSNPIPAEILTDYWLAALSDSEEETVEEHLLSCDECGDRLRQMIAIAEGVRNLAREGSLRMVVSETFLTRVRDDGANIRQYAVAQGGAVNCTVTANDDILIGRLAANLSSAQRVDLCICDERGVERLRLADIPVEHSAKSIAYQESITFAKAAPSNTLIARLVAVDDDGAEQLVGEYTFRHTRTLPGPAAW